MLQQHQRKPCPIERRPRMLLKDFLNENSNSCSSSGFKSFPRKRSPFNPRSPQKNLIEFDPKPSSNSKNNPTITSKLLRSRSKAASTTISAFQSLMNAVKNIPFTTVKSPSFLPRSLSRRLLQSKFQSSSRKQSQNQVQITVRVKDIIRWTSFRDEMLPPPPPLDYASSPLHCTTSTTITGSTTTTCTTCSSSSNGSSWCDSDFTAEFLPSWVGSNSDPHADEEVGKKYLPCVGKDFMEEEASTTGTGSCNIALGPQVEMLLGDEDEQHSPVSVLDCQFGEDEDDSFSSTFDQSLANVGDEDEEMAMELLNYFKATSSSPGSCEEGHLEDKLLLDFFREEMSVQRNQNDDGFQWEMVSKAKAWVSGEHNELEWGLEHKKEACVRDMHKGGRWNKFEYEQEELALEIETAMTDFLMEELLVDLLSR
ncbi:PREDICTED: unnamed product [Prunus dulcis]|uniref:PREDICTED: unnamed product n=1 Tax=Prunus dulcis TaxID=3755 RepID=A0A5E4EV93_PRUDU|nr:uncharacterized protein LOC117619067 [Prunus dulcis]VVA19402.1 PREDICTED: unnamed product [Prunus dulcis]